MKLLLPILLPISLFAMDNGNQQWDGKHYKHNSSHQFRAAMEILSTLHLAKYSRILDVGSGCGQVTAEIAKKAPQSHVVGIDLSQSMVNEAQTTYKDVKNLEFHQVDTQCNDTHFFLQCANNFDFAFSSAVFLWIENKKAALDNIHMALKSGGHLVIKTTASRPATHPLNRALMKIAQNPKWAAFVHAYMSKPQSFPLSCEQAQELLGTQKWTNVQITSHPILNLFDTNQEFLSWMHAWMGGLPAVAALEKEKQTELCHDFITEYVGLPDTHNTEGKIIYSLPGILIQADKK